MNTLIPRGRGTVDNPPNRFEALRYESDPDLPPEERPAVQTRFYRDHSRSLITYNDTPDLSFNASANPYRGCEHGCVYCYARPTHEYLGLGSGLDFESKIMVKTQAAELLSVELENRKWVPQTVAMSGVTDCYQPGEKHFQLTRACLKVFNEYRNPVTIVTKNRLVTRDVDLLGEMAAWNGAAVFISVTTLHSDLASVLEPRAPRPAARLEAISTLTKAGIPVGVLVAPVIPVLTESEIPSILKAASQAGAIFAGYTILRLPHAVKDLFSQWLDQHFPEKKSAVLSRIRAIRGGKLNDPNFGTRMKGTGVYADQIKALFKVSAKRSGLNEKKLELATGEFRRAQMQLL